MRAMRLSVLAVASSAALLAACTPTVNVKVEPINIYAKLDADVRVRLDREVQDLIRNNPDIF
ncbi:MAG: YnbE family lipoprotein [Proteobacteria bacterium]|nr:YnbE family lipoprotein [Pseudomonadota bacterium]MBW3618309.1 YnbE family lipoprotein [Pseudomonadota bacterium]